MRAILAGFWVGVVYTQVTPIFPQVVWKAGDTLANAWSGGLHAPQFSTIDLTGDNQDEMVVFDRMDGRILIFERQGALWVYRPDLSVYFPRVHHWMLLRDYDGDGDKDLFTATPVGSNIRLWRNVNPAGAPPIWQLAYDTIRSSYYGYVTPLYSGSIDLPGIVDVDGDGDLDFLVYEVLGTLIEWHRNKAMELLNRPDTLILEMASSCWGHVYENYDYATNQFSFSNYSCGTGQRPQRVQHAGGSLLPIQLNGDTLVDLIVGDFGPPYLIAGYNSGTRTIAHIDPATAQAPYPPAHPAVMPDFPAAFYEDGNGDGIPDLMVANNDGLSGIDRYSVWFYPNIGRIDSPAWAPPIIGWLQNTMIDIGTGAHPTLADLNADGYPDLILSCRQTYQPSGPTARAWLFLGNAQGFTLADSNWLNLSQYSNLTAPIFTVGDIDGNQRLDLIMGTSTGNLWRWEETSPNNGSFQLLSQSFLSVSSEAAPLLYDIDNDSDPDLLVGTRNGRLSLFINQNGSFQLLTDYLGQIEVRDTLSTLLGFARPAILPLPSNTPLLLVGNMTGFLRLYQPDWNNPTAPWTSVGDLTTEIRTGTFASPSTWAYNDSTWLAVGIRRGGIQLYRLSGLISSLSPRPPSPARTYSLTLTENGFYIYPSSSLILTLLDASGKVLLEAPVRAPAFFERPVARGLYFLRIIEANRVSTHRLFWD